MNAASTESTTTGLGLSLTSVAYGPRPPRSSPSRSPVCWRRLPRGDGTVYNSSTKLCGATLNPGTGDVASATCALTASELAGSKYDDVFATYTPGSPSSSDPSYTYGTSTSNPAQAFSVGTATPRPASGCLWPRWPTAMRPPRS